MGTWDVGVLDNDAVLDMMYSIGDIPTIPKVRSVIDKFMKSGADGDELLLIAELVDTSLNGVDCEILMNDTGDDDLYGYKSFFAWIADNPMPEYLDWSIGAIDTVRKWDDEVGWDEDCIDDRNRILDKISNRLNSYKESHR